ncbi:hypothetical protein [Paludisphaera mucosa]|uniref:Uncharacterized protein n=1 Tax=Paludisphaera mucosa TaxID=3030827 RepID=A0ABT6F6Q6_9BACT|nr:hypothetical protein [Paludisphaera mucosa]MDG3003260.1 hypothetical protein [Paludisphaera mucosa]
MNRSSCEVRCDVSCDVCAVEPASFPAHGEFGGVSPGILGTILKYQGWLVGSNGLHLCPRCHAASRRDLKALASVGVAWADDVRDAGPVPARARAIVTRPREWDGRRFR